MQVTDGLYEDWLTLALAYGEVKRWDKAAEYYTKALTYKPTDVPLAYNAARALAEAKSFEKALSLTQLLAKSQPDNRMDKELRAWILGGMGRQGEAVPLYRELLDDEGDNYRLLYNYLFLVQSLGELLPLQATARAESLFIDKADMVLLLLKDQLKRLPKPSGATPGGAAPGAPPSGGAKPNAAASLNQGADPGYDHGIALHRYFEDAGGLNKETSEELGRYAEARGDKSQALLLFKSAAKADPKDQALRFKVAALTWDDDYDAGLTLIATVLKEGYADPKVLQDYRKTLDGERLVIFDKLVLDGKNQAPGGKK